MQPNFMFCHTVTIEPYLRRDISRDVYGEPKIVSCRINPTAKLTHSGTSPQEETYAAGTIYMDAGADVHNRDRVTVNGEPHTVLTVTTRYNLNGSVNHIEVLYQ